jgi:hypothetical protein
MSKCSILSRRIRTSRRRPSTVAASITASRGWRPRADVPRRFAPKRRTSHAVNPIKASTTKKAMKNRAASGISEPNKLSNINVLRSSGGYSL